jgi:site-specific DNA recombinase
MKAIILARVSHTKQDSNEAQLARITDYIKSKDLEVWKTYEIEESSTKADRKKFQLVIKDIEQSKEPIALIADTVDRVQRSFRESVLLDDLRKAGKLEIHFYRENLVVNKSSNSADLLRWDMAVMFARSYVLQLSDNVKRKQEQMRRNGIWSGRVRLGYLNIQERDEHGKIIKKDIIVDPDRAHLIQRIFELYSTGNYSLMTLWQEITRLGLKSHDGKRLSNSNIAFILSDPFFYGMALSKKHGLFPHRYPTLITRELFEKCQDILHGRRKSTSKPLSDIFIFKGLLHCPKCGCMMTPEIKKGKFIYYSCTNSKGICKREYVPEAMLLKPVYDLFKRFTGIPLKVQERLVKELRTVNEGQVEFHNREVERIQTEYRRVQGKLDTLLELRLDKSITTDDYDKKLKELKDRQYNLNIELEEHTKADHDYHIHVNTVLNLTRRMQDIFESSEIPEKRQILNFLLQNPVVNGKKLEFTMRKPFDAVLELAQHPTRLPDLGSNQDKRIQSPLSYH